MSLWIAPRPLVLASRSPARQQLLAAAGVEFVTIVPDLDERRSEAPPRRSGASGKEIARHLAQAKAEAVSASRPDDLVLAADQVLECGGRLFSKPMDRAGAAAQLLALAGRAHFLHSAFCLMRNGRICSCETLTARLTMRRFDSDFVELYLAAAGDAIFDCVGAYRFEGLGVHLFEAVEGDQATILGLPLLQVLAALRLEGAVAS